MKTVLTNTAVVNLTILVLCVIAFLVISYKIVRLNRPGLLICYIFLVFGGMFWGAKHYKIQSISDILPKEEQREKTFNFYLSFLFFYLFTFNLSYRLLPNSSLY